MSGRLHRWTVLAGLLIWFAIGLPAAAADVIVAPSGWWWAAYGAYGALLAVELSPVVRDRPRLVCAMTLVRLPVGVTAFALDGGYGFSSVLLVVGAAAAALTLPMWQTLVVVLAQAVAMVLSHVVWDHGPTDLFPVAEALIFVGFQLFAVSMVEAGLREARRRAELSALTVELAAAHCQLAESSRAGERLRIARDLHDAMGHQLTALAVHLEVAAHLVHDEARDHVEQSRQMAKDALGEVRLTVSRLRDAPGSLREALHAMVASVPGLEVHLSVDSRLDTGSPVRDDAVIRCCQEIVTNTIRHAEATNLWITVEFSGGLLRVVGHDDGRGASRLTAGNGLTGMRERFEQLGGSVSISIHRGFAVEARLPA